MEVPKIHHMTFNVQLGSQDLTRLSTALYCYKDQTISPSFLTYKGSIPFRGTLALPLHHYIHRG